MPAVDPFHRVLGSRRGATAFARATASAEILCARPRITAAVALLSASEARTASTVLEHALRLIAAEHDPHTDSEVITVIRGRWYNGDVSKYRTSVEELVETRGASGLHGALRVCAHSENRYVEIGDENIGERYSLLSSSPEGVALQLAWLIATDWEWLTDLGAIANVPTSTAE